MFSGMQSVRPSVRCPLTTISRDALSLYLWVHFTETFHKLSSREWELLKSFSRSEVTGQGHSKTKFTFAAEAYISISTVWRRGSLVRTSFAYRFLPRSMQCRRGLAMRILSVCLSVRHTRAMWQNGRKICPDLYTIRKNIYPSFLRRRRMVGGGDPFYVKFWVNRPPLERNRRFSTNNRS